MKNFEELLRATPSRQERLAKVRSLIARTSFKVLGREFNINAELDKVYGGRVYLQVSYLDRCRVSGKIEEWKGRKWYLSSHMTDDEIVKTAFVACKSVVEHEVMEGFTVDGKVLFNPHVSFEALLSI